MDVLAADGAPFPPALQAEFDRLRRNFEAGLAARWRDIDQAATPEARIFALHRLAGAAASYGHEELGHCAKQAEECAKAGDECRLGPLLDRLAVVMMRHGPTAIESPATVAETSQCSNKCGPHSVSNAQHRTTAQGVLRGN